ncbi:predicted protein [Arabidopsis lyrata subsp. lyrata]|uniref:Predicted protein n=1 Tax=Arabidopsis lyrata subsp. lyrata TaxID=81972 RepID=D7KZ49_ARALL|nr:predicted protein [Arabidopsis lyrata subsp. lyrata]
MAAISLELESLLEASYRHIKLKPLKSLKKELLHNLKTQAWKDKQLLHSLKTQVWSDKTQFGVFSRFSQLHDKFPKFPALS